MLRIFRRAINISTKGQHNPKTHKGLNLLRNISYSNFSKDPEKRNEKRNQSRKRQRDIYEAKKKTKIQETIQRIKQLKFSKEQIESEKDSENLSTNNFQKIIELKNISKTEIIKIMRDKIKIIRLYLFFNIFDDKNEKKIINDQIKIWENLEKTKIFNNEFAKTTLEISQFMASNMQNLLQILKNSPVQDFQHKFEEKMSSDFFIDDKFLEETIRIFEYLLLDENLPLYSEKLQKIMYDNDIASLQFINSLQDHTNTFEEKVKELHDKSMEFLENNPNLSIDQKTDKLKDQLKQIYT
jgi:hypothetical protein